MAELVNAQTTLANNAAENNTATDSQSQSTPPPITEPSTSYEYESAGPTPGLEPPKGVSDIAPENAPLYQSEIPPGAEAQVTDPEVTLAGDAAIAGTTQVGTVYDAPVVLAGDAEQVETTGGALTQAETTVAGAVNQGEAATADAATTDPNAVQIEDTPTVTAQDSQAGQATTEATEGVQTELSPEALSAVHLERITSIDSPLMRATAQRALEAMNSRGLSNSSLAVGAAHRAMVEAAVPLALNDAQTGWKHQELNQTFAHEAIQNDANRAADVSVFNAEQRTIVDRANVDRALEAGMFTVQEHNDINTTNANIKADFIARNADSENAVAIANAEMVNAMEVRNTEMANAREEFNTAEANRLAALNSSDANAMAQFNADLMARTLQFNAAEVNRLRETDADAANRLAQFNASEHNRMAQINMSDANEMARFNAESVNRRAEFDAKEANNLSMFSAAERNAISDANAARYAAIQQGNTAEANKHAQFIMEMEAELSKQYLAGESALSLADLQGKYQKLISTNASAAQIYEGYFNGVASTLANKDLSASAMSARIAVQKHMLDRGLDLISDINNIDFDLRLP